MLIIGRSHSRLVRRLYREAMRGRLAALLAQPAFTPVELCWAHSQGLVDVHRQLRTPLGPDEEQSIDQCCRAALPGLLGWSREQLVAFRQATD
jgi:hypothetical protein